MTASEKQDKPTAEETPGRPGNPYYVRLGAILIALSGVLWFSLFAIPFLPLTLGQKTALGGAVFLGVQVAWWSGVTLTGPAAVRNLRGWFRRSKKRPPRQ